MPRRWRVTSASRGIEVSVTRYRSVEDMPPPWRDADDPGNLRMVATMMALHRRLSAATDQPERRVQRFRSIEELSAARDDPYAEPPPRQG